MARTAELPATSAEARDRVLALLRGCQRQLDEMAVADALLITSELVTNALRHAGGVTRFVARVTGDLLELTVEDASPVPPVVPADIRDGRIGGYGWSLVHRLATSVTVVPSAAGKGIQVALRLM
ncbi:ATP-binding protein [Streptomyces sp. NPDC020883]|uniref:ATP-binding protein n=1 Tax=Streptomyces sp. NPDC020883 TaxID=3365099 RepID=UPI0037B04939